MLICVPIVMVGIAFVTIRHEFRKESEKDWFRRLTRNAKPPFRALLLKGRTEPSASEVQAWLESLRGGPIPRGMSRFVMKAWAGAPQKPVVRVAAREDIYRDLTGRGGPTPFETDAIGGSFVCSVNSRRLGWSLVQEFEREDLNAFEMGYTTLWEVEVLELMPGDPVALACPEPVHGREEIGDYVAFRDPVLQYHDMTPFGHVVATGNEFDVVRRRAEEFNIRHGIAVCVGRIRKKHFWH